MHLCQIPVYIIYLLLVRYLKVRIQRVFVEKLFLNVCSKLSIETFLSLPGESVSQTGCTTVDSFKYATNLKSDELFRRKSML